MTETIDFVRIFMKQFNELDKLRQLKSKEQSDCDIAVSSLYHKIEGINIKHVSQSHALIKELKVLLIKRRENKLEVAILRTVCDSLMDKIGQLKLSIPKAIAQHDKVIAEITERAKL